MQTIEDNAFCLRRWDFSETSQTASLLTRDHGVLRGLAKGAKRPKPGRTKVVFGAPLQLRTGESTRSLNRRIEAAVTRLGDEALTDYWVASRRAATGENPALTGPEYNGWRRQWALADHRKLGAAGLRRRQKRRWPNLG